MTNVADDAWYNYVYLIILPRQNKYPVTCFIYQNFGKKRYIENPKVDEEIKRDICKSLVKSDVADDAWDNYVYNSSFWAK